jgi:hypothetical protein
LQIKSFPTAKHSRQQFSFMVLLLLVYFLFEDFAEYQMSDVLFMVVLGVGQQA